MTDTSAVAAYRQAIQSVGVQGGIVYNRNTGLAPNVTTVSAPISAIVRTMQPDTTSPAQDGMSASAPGQLNQDMRLVIAIVSDLVAGGISLPVQRGDTISIPLTGETLNVLRSDPYKRAFAGAVEIMAAAIA